MAGSVLVERLASIGQKVLIVESRDHIGGNCYDFYDEHGIFVPIPMRFLNTFLDLQSGATMSTQYEQK